jgi:hypothetical protein
MNITSEFFLVLTCESDSCILQLLNKLNLTYRRLTGFVTLFYFIPIVLCHTPIRPILAFRDEVDLVVVVFILTLD